MKPKDPLAKAHVQAPPFDLVTSERNKEKERKEFERERQSVSLKVINFQSLAHGYLEKERDRDREWEREIFETHLRFSSVLQKWLQEPHKNIRKW